MKHTEIEDSQYLTKILLRYGQTIFPIIGTQTAPEYVDQILAWHTSQLRATLERLKEKQPNRLVGVRYSTSISQSEAYMDGFNDCIDAVILAIDEELSKLEDK